MMKIGVLYICTGKYSIFWENFHRSCKQYFLTNCDVHFFVFTDDKNIVGDDHIHVNYESPKGFPMDSLLRFDMFLSIESALIEMDYLFFFNSNMEFVSVVGNEILPVKNSSGLVSVIHPGFFNNDCTKFPYERNKKSTSYIPFLKNNSYFYFMGSLNGGRTREYLNLSRICRANIQLDMKKGIIAIYHDESHLNKYLHGTDVLRLSPAYAFPEDAALPFQPKILILNKMKHGGKYFDKLPSSDYLLRLYFKFKRIYSFFIWKFQ